MPGFSLKTKMSVAVSVLVAVLMAGSAFLSIRQFGKRFKEIISAQQYELVREMARDLDVAIEDAHRVLIAKAGVIPPETAADPVAAQRLLDAETDLHAIFNNGIFVFSPRGKMVAEFPDNKRRGADFSYREYFRRTMETGRPLVSDPYLSSQSHHHPCVMFTVPLRGRDGKIAAVLAGSVDLTTRNFLGGHTEVTIGKTGYLYVFGTDRTMIMHPDRSRIMKKDVPVGANRVFDKAIAGFDGTEETVNSRGLHALTSVRHLKSVNWILAANYPIAEAYAPIREATRDFLIAAVIGVALSILIVGLVMRRLTAPLHALTGHMRKLTEDRAAVPELALDSGDEFQEVATTFNALMRRLGRKREELRKLSLAVEGSASLVVITDTDGKITYTNPKFRQVTGYSADEVIGQNPRILKSGEMPAETYRQLWETITSGREWQGEFHNKKKDGERYWAVATISPVRNDDGAITHFISIQEDITDRKREEWRLANQFAVSSILAESPTVGEAIPRVLEAICKAIGWDLGTAWWVNPGGIVLRLANSWHGPGFDATEFLEAGRARNFGPGIGLPGRVWSSRRAAWIDDVLLDDNYPPKPFAAACGLRGAFAFPISLGGTIAGVMEFHSRQVRKFDPMFLNDMASIGAQLGQLIERKRDHDALLESERRFRETLENIRLAAVKLDLDGNIVFCNDFLVELCGWKREEILGRNWFEMFRPAADGARELHAARVAGGTIPIHSEDEIVTRSGERRLMAWSHTVLYAPDGAASGTASIGEDITARREAEDRLHYISMHDLLTGLYNRSFFDLELTRLARSRRYPVSVISIDVDGLKEVNDARGHEAGDRLLRAAARVLQAAFREDDVVARVGGDEFAVLLPATDVTAASEAVARIRQCQDDANAKEKDLPVSLSVGAATADRRDDLNAALQRSDQRMYEDKLSRRAGRGRAPAAEISREH